MKTKFGAQVEFPLVLHLNALTCPLNVCFSLSRILNMVTRQGASWANSLGSVGKSGKSSGLIMVVSTLNSWLRTIFQDNIDIITYLKVEY